ncbi:MAG: diaminopimelate decarboxylase [Myxococcales bacterium]|nr:diaminopimelate decarboxylase [Myxococcota bacterium]MDW8280374.1 diaminopimelate decarboxylase [Myxococcales bacterium]
MYSRRDGILWIEQVRLDRLLAAGLPTPLYLYSLAELRRCYAAWAEAVSGLDATVGYAIKANPNPHLLRELARLGAGAIVASEGELRQALGCGFAGAHTVLHGNGKRPGDIEAALRAGALLSVDSPFDLAHIEEAAGRLGCQARLLLRINPDIDPQVHPYVATGLQDSKFGMTEAVLQGLRPALRALRHSRVCGLHSHIGSLLMEPGPFVAAGRIVLQWAARLRDDGHPIDTVDLGGGLGIDYSRRGEPAPTPSDLIGPLRAELQAAGLRLVVEPGRSLVGSCGALLGRVLGVKHGGSKSFLVTDASMAQLIRPALYGAYHHIELVAPGGEVRRFDVVGPLCESADFLGLARQLPTPAEGDGLLVFDVGAYGACMASRYNLQLGPAEYIVDGARLICSRRAETWEDFARPFVDQEVAL